MYLPSKESLVKRLLLFASISFATIAAASNVSPNGGPPFGILVGDKGIVVSGSSSHQTVYVVGFSRIPHRYYAESIRQENLLVDDHGDGSPRVDFDEPVAPRSLWIGVDLASGRWAVSSSSSTSVHKRDTPPGLLKKSSGAEYDRVDVRAERIELIWIRPGVGAWATTNGDGGLLDDDHEANGHVVTAASSMHPLAGSPPAPANFKTSDVVIAVDPVTLDVIQTEVRP
jgi:hypothetical protein